MAPSYSDDRHRRYDVPLGPGCQGVRALRLTGGGGNILSLLGIPSMAAPKTLRSNVLVDPAIGVEMVCSWCDNPATGWFEENHDHTPTGTLSYKRSEACASCGLYWETSNGGAGQWVAWPQED